MVNPEDDSVSIFSTADNVRRATVKTGREPVAVVVHPDGNTAFVANRAAATVAKISGIAGAAPSLAATVDVGSEPTGLALTPTGAKLFVAEWAEGRVSVVDTATMTVIGAIAGLRNPRALAVSNNRNGDDGDEVLAITEFYGEPNPNVSACPGDEAEACDSGRRGRVLLYGVGSVSAQTPILFSPLDSGMAPAGTPPGTATVMTSPNQLGAVAIQGNRLYVTSVSASPQAPIRFNANVFPVVYVGDLTTRTEDRSGVGSANLARLATDALGDAPGTDRLFLGDLTDIAFETGTNVAYAVSRAADAVQALVYDVDSGIRIGHNGVQQIDAGARGCRNPTGIVVANAGGRAYVNCWLSRNLGVVDLTTQTMTTVVASAPLPETGTAEDSVQRGRRFFFTGRGRWSDESEGYSSCASCHPDGLSDGITWSFGAGPRQSTSLDGSFSHGPGEQKQRAFNWTANFDEIHDFNRNTIAVSGGLGAITRSLTNQCGNLAAEQRVAVSADGLGQPVKEVQDNTPGICVTDFDDVENFVRAIRPPRGLRGLDPAAVARGSALFGPGNGSCTTCHGGAGWTVSRRFWTPSSALNDALAAMSFEPPVPASYWPPHATQLAVQPAGADNTGAVIEPKEIACVLRRVGSFGLPGDAAATATLEKKVDGTRAQGNGGFNVPSLYGLAVGAPYLHHGQATTLTALFDDPQWQAHTRSGNPGFAPSPQEKADLIQFLLSIDASTTLRDVPVNADACPVELLAALSGEHEPVPVTSDATGTVTVLIDGTETQMTVTLATQGLADATSAQIHAGPPGLEGPILFALYERSVDGPLPAVLTKRLTAANFMPGGGLLTFDDAVEAIRRGSTYVNVHTLQNPNGEVRGQIAATELHADLAGDNEEPPVTTAALGRASLGITAGAIVVALDTQGLVGTSQAHIHCAPPGVNGPVIFSLYNSQTGGPFTSPFTTRLTAADLVPVASIPTFEAAVAAIEDGRCYVNVHTISNPAGEIRGQIGVTELHAALLGDNEVPPVTTTAGGRATLGLTSERITVTLVAESLGGATGGFIQLAPPGANGATLFAFYDSQTDGPLPSSFTAALGADDLMPANQVNSFADALAAIRAGDTYVNVATVQNPAGEIRGQVLP